MTAYRVQQVLARLVDIASFSNYCYERFFSLQEPLAKGETIAVPSLGTLTVYPDGSVERLSGDRNNPAPSTLTLTVDQEPFIPVQIPKRSSIQNLNGAWDSQLADQVMIQLRNYQDSLVLDTYLAGTLCWTASGATTYVQNVEGDSLTATNLLTARGLLLRKQGTFQQNCMWIFDPLAIAAVMGLSGWQNQAIGAQEFGAQTIGRIYGIDVVETQGVRTSKTHAITASNVATNVATLTFATNPGLQNGQYVSTSGLSANATNQLVSNVSSDGLTCTVPITHADGSIGTGTLTELSACNLIVDRTHVYTAAQVVPGVRMIEDPNTTGEILQASTLFGYIGRAGRCYMIRSPDSSI